MKTHFNTTFLFILLAVVGFGVYLVFKPFIVALLIAFVISQLFGSWYKKMNKLMKGRQSLASLATCIIILFIIFIPLVFVSSLVISEANQLIQNFQSNEFVQKLESISLGSSLLGIEITNDELQSFIGTKEFSDSFASIGKFILQAVKMTYQGTSNFLFMTFVMFFSLYYLFKDGDKLLKKLMDLSPLKNSQEKLIIDKFVTISRATLKGTLVIALIQGFITAVLFLITGVNAAVLWGLITVVVSLVPLIGPVLVWTPVAIVMLLMGNIWQGITIILVGAIVISMIDNFLRPKLVGNDSSLHPLLVFLSTLGGIALFGIAGFLLGPVILVLFITLLHIYHIEFKSALTKFNK